MRAGTKFPEDDFFCWRYQVWYNSLDCAARTRYRTAPGCRDCAQGEGNLALRRSDLARVHWPGITIGFADSPDLDPTDEAVPAPLSLVR